MRVTLGVLLVISSACGGKTPPARYERSTFERGEEKFHVAPPAGWSRVPTRGDLAWRAAEGDAVIAANATCRGHYDVPLQVLISDLLIGTTDRAVLLSEDAWLDGRAARHDVIALRLDGVPLVYDLYVLKKDGCVYDLSLVVPPARYDRVADGFVAFVAGFRGLGAGPGAPE